MRQAQRGTRRQARLASDLTILAVVGVLLVIALAAGGRSLYQQFYSPSAFVERYLELVSDGRAADALQIPGVAVDSALLAKTGLDAGASEALLRHAALAPLTETKVVGEEQDGEVYTVTVDYRAGHTEGTSNFIVAQDGWRGVTPNWRFAASPLAEIDLTLSGADQFSVNGFEIDRRQISVDGMDASPDDPLPLLVFTPGLYSVSVDTAVSSSAGVSVLADAPLARTPVNVQAEPTAEFVEIVQKRVTEFLNTCATQEVLLPTACPFGFEVQNRVTSPPKWSIVRQPEVTVVPDGQDWVIPATEAVARIEVDIQSLFDGSIQRLSEDVAFQVNGTIIMLADGSASIRVGSPNPAGG